VAIDVESLSQEFATILPHLDERQRRIVLGVKARALGRGGVSKVAQASGVSRATVTKAVQELDAGIPVTSAVRRPGGGRKPLTQTDPGLMGALDALVGPATRGDPESPLLWCSKSTRQLAEALTREGHPISHPRVGDLLERLGYNLQANVKTKEGGSHPDRDAQFHYLNEQVKAFLDAGDPVISVDTKKKELVGDFKNAGREWQPIGEPVEVRVHDFADPALGKAIPYGVYDVSKNAGWVSVGKDHDTAAFAVETIRRWWLGVGTSIYPSSARLMICADGGGSNGSRVRLWKTELARLADEQGVEITVCHLPPGTSKWNKIEHRLFSHISMNWRGRPLTSHEVIVELIGSTRTRTGLQVHAELDPGFYATGIKISDKQFSALKQQQIRQHSFHGDWNYTVVPGNQLRIDNYE